MELAAQLGADFLPLGDPALLAIYHRQQELVWTEDLVEHIEDELEEAGAWAGPGGSRRCGSWTWWATPGSPRSGAMRPRPRWPSPWPCWSTGPPASTAACPVKWLGDGVMVHFREPAGAVLSALELVAQLPEAGLPPAHVGVAAGPVVVQGGDYFGRTVNLAARIAAHAAAGQVLVSQRVAESPRPRACASWSWGSCSSRGSPVRCGCWRPAGPDAQPQTGLRWG